MSAYAEHSIIPYVSDGRLAQLDRALVSGTKGRGFDPRIARHSFFSIRQTYDEVDWPFSFSYSNLYLDLYYWLIPKF